MRKRILLIATGGTIASGKGVGGLQPYYSGTELLSFIPEVKELCELFIRQLMNIDSTNMRPEHWLLISGEIQKVYDRYDGFVILHGTDTLAYTAAALSYLIQKSVKPVVLTGSQKPVTDAGSDAKQNLLQGVLYALEEDSCGVSVVFGGKVIAGTRARKQKTRSEDAFVSINFPLLAEFAGNTVIRNFPLTKPKPGQTVFYRRLDSRIFLMKLIPTMDAEIIPLLKPWYEALILEAFGIGGVPDCGGSFASALFDWVNSGKILAVTTQVPEEGCDFGIYQVGNAYHNQPGILETGNMTVEAVTAKLAWAMGQTSDRKEIQKLFGQTVNFDDAVYY